MRKDDLALPSLPSRPPARWWRWAVLFLLLLGAAVWYLDISFTGLLVGLADIVEYFSRYRQPDFKALPHYVALMGNTLALALWGTWLALVLGVLLAPLAARNLSPNAWIYRASREVLSFMRAMPDLLLALIFVAVLGLGPLPGVLALGIHTAGFLGKFFAENMERVDKGAYEGLAATGAGFGQTVMLVGWPSTMREAAGHTLYVFDRNVRMASVLGLVGAGGIGAALHDALRLFDYNQASALILVILVTLVAIDYLSAWLRTKIA